MQSTAYPRSRGGTAMHGLAPLPRKGLSPLARGNHVEMTAHACRTGPIPARAGEPQSKTQTVCGWRAYPRSRGGTCVVSRS